MRLVEGSLVSRTRRQNRAPGGDPMLRDADVGVRGGPVAMLEHLDADHERPDRLRRKDAEATTD